MDSLYQAHILEHYKHPHHKQVMNDADLMHRGKNVSCGDDLTWYIKWEEGNIKKVSEASFDGYGCAISQAAASLLSDKLRGMTEEEIKSLTREDMLALLHVDIGPMREKCAMLALNTLKEMI
ncbi:MAG TPA: SUF system NifU family Fe-S cluster assembly protein [Candidatus Paceibacterota bacterium]|nr:SUF system NifU family Fe-S cluster assembly protein [Candidatus Paceibacterota bacterium]